ncbi:hypothetical protein D044_2065B, partial [Vibrio parahaemolyticus EKP-026]
VTFLKFSAVAVNSFVISRHTCHCPVLLLFFHVHHVKSVLSPAFRV